MSLPSAQQYDVLIVEDDPMVGIVNRRFCEQMPGFRVVGLARTALEAVQLLKVKSPDLVLLDVYMGGSSGLTVLEQIRRSAAAVDVIMLTAANDPATIAHAMRLSVVDYLIKPYDFDRFAEAIQRYARFHSLLHGEESIEQRALDRFRSDEESAPQRDESPKGLDPLTLESFEVHMRRAESPLTVDLQYGSVGRPRRLYFRK